MCDFNSIDWEWVDLNKDKDPLSLSLKYGNKKKLEIIQIECRRKTAKKLYQTLKNPFFVFPSDISAQQSSSDDMASFHASLIEKGERVLDMTSGLGIDSLHLSEKAESVKAFDLKSENIAASIHNASLMKINNVEYIHGDSVQWLSTTSLHFDTVFIDPSRRDQNNRRCYDFSDCSPDILSIMPLLSLRTSKVIVKASPMLDISRVVSQIHGVKNIYLLGNERECKELVVLIDFKYKGDFSLHSVTFTDSGINRFDFSEKFDYPPLGFIDPKLNGYIYLPFPAIMKAGRFSDISDRFRIPMIARDTHLFYSDNLNEKFPGDIFHIIDIIPYNNKNIKSFRNSYSALNITTKNFGLSSVELARKLKIKDSGELRLFAVSLSDKTKVLLVTELVSKK